MRLAENKKCNLAENGLEDDEQHPSTHAPDPGGGVGMFLFTQEMFRCFCFSLLRFSIRHISFEELQFCAPASSTNFPHLAFFQNQ